MENDQGTGKREIPLPLINAAALSLLTAVIYFLSNPEPQNYYDYTFRVAADLLRGNIGFISEQPSWLNEMVPFEGFYYSVFPLGAVLSMIPAALLQIAGLVTDMPGSLIAAVLAGVVCFLLLKISSEYDVSRTRQLVQAAGILFGTFMWTNLTFAGAWQLALGFAVVGELGAIYFTVYDRRPFIAGIFFAMAFGNRTENLLTAPVFMYFLCRGDDTGNRRVSLPIRFSPADIRRLAAFCVVPLMLGIGTLLYNDVRFHSFTDFGYARIPGVLDEPWYDRGIFSLSYLSGQAWEMLFKSWESSPTFPYLRPNAFSSTILWSSPFLLFVFRFGAPAWLRNAWRTIWRLLRRHIAQNVRHFPRPGSLFSAPTHDRDAGLIYACWAAIIVLTSLLWMHGNSGGYQFGYRYAMVLLPWIYVLLLETAPKRFSTFEAAAYIFSFAANLYATWLYHWTDYMKV